MTTLPGDLWVGWGQWRVRESSVEGVATNRLGQMQSQEGLGGSRNHVRVVMSLSQMVLVRTSRSECGMTRRTHGEQGRKEQVPQIW